jgi:hypothetical protein
MYIGIQVVVSFGSEFFLFIINIITFNMEGNMKNSIAIITIIMASVWCGNAFLRSLVELFQPKREMGMV